MTPKTKDGLYQTAKSKYSLSFLIPVCNAEINFWSTWQSQSIFIHRWWWLSSWQSWSAHKWWFELETAAFFYKQQLATWYIMISSSMSAIMILVSRPIPVRRTSNGKGGWADLVSIAASAALSLGLIDTSIVGRRNGNVRVEAFTSDDCDEEQLCLYHPLDVSPPP